MNFTIKGKDIFKAGLFVFIGTFLSNSLGFIRELIIAHNFGASYITDSYNLALNYTIGIMDSIFLSLAMAQLPIYIKLINKKDYKRLWNFISSTITYITIFLILYIIIVNLNAKHIIHLIAPGFKDKRLYYSIILFKYLNYSLIFSFFAYLSLYILHSFYRFKYPAFLGVSFNIAIISCLLIFKEQPLKAFILGNLLGALFKLLIQLPDYRGLALNVNINLNIKNLPIKEFIFLFIPLFLVKILNHIFLNISHFYLSYFPVKIITYYNYAKKVGFVPVQLTGIVISIILYPLFTKLIENKEYKKLSNLLINAILLLIIITVPITIIFGVFNFDIIKILFHHGLFTIKDCQITANYLFYFSFSIILSSIIMLLFRIYISLKKLNIFITINLVSLIFFFIFIYIYRINFYSVAISEVLANFITLILSFLYLNKIISIKLENQVSKILFNYTIFLVILILFTLQLKNLHLNLFLELFLISASILIYLKLSNILNYFYSLYKEVKI